MGRPSHDLLMQATEALIRAYQIEQEAGNRGVAMVLNDMTLNLFQVALSTEVDGLANAAHDVRYPRPTVADDSKPARCVASNHIPTTGAACSVCGATGMQHESDHPGGAQ